MPELEVALASASGLADACWRRDWVNLCRCLAAGKTKIEIFVNLHLFQRTQFFGFFKNLIFLECLVAERDSSGLTPLQICSALGWTEAVLLLLKHGADVNQACSLGWTPLMQAVRNGHSDIVRILINAGADISVKNSYGTSC